MTQLVGDPLDILPGLKCPCRPRVAGPRFAAPLIGGESFEVLAEELGFNAEEVADLMASGAIN